MQKLNIFRGDSQNIQLAVTNQDGSVFNLTGYSVKFTAKGIQQFNISKIIEKTTADDIEILNAAGGIALIKIKPTDTNIAGLYNFDVQVYKLTDEVYTVVKGELIISEDISS